MLTCEAYGRPTPTIVWSKMLTRVNELGDPLIRDPGNGSLIFERLQDNHSGVYLCEIEGTGSTTSQTRLMVVDMNADSGVGKLEEIYSYNVYILYRTYHSGITVSRPVHAWEPILYHGLSYVYIEKCTKFTSEMRTPPLIRP